MTNKLTKEYIIEILKKQYEETGEIPKSKDKYPFSVRTVSNRFGSW